MALGLWDLGVGSITCNATEMEKLGSTTTHPSLCQQLQNSRRQVRGQDSHSLTEWVMVAILTVWANVDDMPDMVSKWQSFTDLVQVLQELGMHQAIFNPNIQGLMMNVLQLE